MHEWMHLIWSFCKLAQYRWIFYQLYLLSDEEKSLKMTQTTSRINWRTLYFNTSFRASRLVTFSWWLYEVYNLIGRVLICFFLSGVFPERINVVDASEWYQSLNIKLLYWFLSNIESWLLDILLLSLTPLGFPQTQWFYRGISITTTQFQAQHEVFVMSQEC